MRETKLRPQASRVLDYIRQAGSDSDSNIGLALGIPAASVRRSLQELIHIGYPVTYSYNGVYTFATQDEPIGAGGF